MKNYFAYIRVSTLKQGEGASLEAQKEAIASFAERNNLTITKWFEEKETAAKQGRPIFTQMIKDLRKRDVDGLIVHKLDRLTRNLTEYARIGELIDEGLMLHTAIDSLDVQSRGGRLTAEIQAVIAADYVRNLREETIKGLQGRLKQGFYPFRAPIGYLDNGKAKYKTFDPVRAPLVRHAFELYASGGYSLRVLLAEMQRLGLQSRDGKRLTLTGLDTMLSNPFYCGVIRIKRTGKSYQGGHEKLISPALFKRVEDIKSHRCRPKVTKHNHRYRGLFRCAICDGAMVPELQRGNCYYRCRTQNCLTKSVREDSLSQELDRCLKPFGLSDAQMARAFEIVEQWVASDPDQANTSTTQLELGKLGERKDRLTDALLDRLIDKAEYQRRMQRLALEEAQLREVIENRVTPAQKAERFRRMCEHLKSLQTSHGLANRFEERQLLEMATANRTVERKNIRLEPREWVSQTHNAVAVLSGAPDTDTERTLTSLSKIANNFETEENKLANRSITKKAREDWLHLRRAA
ncbi:MAG: recombinase family protein [Pseudomonadota bacterium]